MLLATMAKLRAKHLGAAFPRRTVVQIEWLEEFVWATKPWQYWVAAATPVKRDPTKGHHRGAGVGMLHVGHAAGLLFVGQGL